jgi:hypothetical protein
MLDDEHYQVYPGPQAEARQAGRDRAAAVGCGR